MWPPRRPARNPVDDWLAESDSPDLSPPLPELESTKALRGTVFSDPVRDFLLTQPTERPRTVRAFDRAVDTVFSPIPAVVRKAKQFSDWITTPRLGDEAPLSIPTPIPGLTFQTTPAKAKGFAGGSTEAAAEMSSPFNIAATASGMSGLSRGGGALAALLRTAEATGGGFQSGMMAPSAVESYKRGDYGTAAIEGGMALAGLGLGAHSLLPHEVPWEAMARRAELGHEFGAPWDGPEFTREPGQPGAGIPPEAAPSEPDPLLELLGGDQRALPPAGGSMGPHTPPAPPGSIAAVPQYGRDVRWQHPGGFDERFPASEISSQPEPPAAPQAAPAARPPQGPAPPADALEGFLQPSAADARAAEIRASLRKKYGPNLPPDIIDRFVQETLAQEAQPPTSIIDRLAPQTPPQPPRAPRPAPQLDMAPPVAEPTPASPPEVVGTPAAAEPPLGDPLRDLLRNVNEAKPDVDPLTNLGGRRAWEQAKRQPGRVIGRIDLDNFKSVNDVHGHQAGDRAIKIAGDTLRQFARRAGDEAFRISGDEFGLVLEADPGTDLNALRDRIENAIGHALEQNGLGTAGSKRIGASLGFGADEATADAAAIARKKERGISQPRNPQQDVAPTAPTALATQSSSGRPGGATTEAVPATSIRADPKTYQFKGGADAEGVTDRLKNVESWDPIAGQATPVILHERANGERFVVDGHQRVAMAKRLEAQGRPVPPLNAIVLRESDGVTAGNARRIGAMLNLQQGTGSATDIAKVFREQPLSSLERARIPKDQVSGAKMRTGEELAQLSDDAFLRVVNGQVHPNPGKNEAYGAIVGRLIDNPAEQVSALQALSQAKPDSAFEAEQFVRSILADGFERGTQTDLFGSSEVANSLAEPIAKILASARRTLQSERSALGNAVRNETRLTAKGNVLDTAANTAGAQAAGELDSLLDTYGHTAGPVREELKRAAAEVHAGSLSPAAAADRVLAVLERERGNLSGLPEPIPGGDATGGRGQESLTVADANAWADASQREHEIATARARGVPARPEPGFPPTAGEPVTDLAAYRAAQDADTRAAVDRITGHDPLADLLATSEQQPRLPGAEGVRETETPTPTLAPEPVAANRPPDFSGRISAESAPDLFGTKGDIFDQLAPDAESATALATAEPTESLADRGVTIDDIQTRHEAENPAKVDEIAASMERVGWKGRPALVVSQGDTHVAWTATHRLAAAKQAGLDLADIPTVEVDGQKLVDAGYDLDALSQKGKRGRAQALRAAGFDDAANLLESEVVGSPARTAPLEEGAADVEPVPQNVREFLIRQLRYTPEEVDAMTPAEAREIGNRVRMHPGGTKAGIAEHAKPKQTPQRSTTSGPNLGEGSMRVETDELAKLLGIQERRTALQRTRVEPGEGEVTAPRLTPEQLQRAQTLAGESTAAIAAAKEPPAPPKTQSEIAQVQGTMVQSARARAKLLENPTPENLDEYARQVGEAADRQANREFKGGTAKEGQLKQHERTGEYLASGLGGFEKLYRERPDLFWRAIRTVGGALVGAFATGEDSPLGDDPIIGALLGGAAGAVSPAVLRAFRKAAPTAFKAIKDTFPPAMGGKVGGKPGASPVRAPRNLSKDISGAEMLGYGQPHRTVPDVWRKISPVLDDLAQVEADAPSTTPRLFEFTRKMYVEEAVGEIQQAAKLSRDQGLHRRAKYLDAMIEELHGTPTVPERFLSDITSGVVKPHQARKALGLVERAVYLKLLGAALDTGLLNRTQVMLAAPHIGLSGIAEGMRGARTPEGQALTQHLNLKEPSDLTPIPGMPRVRPGLARRVVNMALSPVRAGDVKNRKDVYLGAMYTARKQGLTAPQAHEYAMEITAQTQGTPGELGANPFHRHLGPLRMFTKYPSIWGQWAADIATHPDPAVRRRGLSYMLGLGAVGAMAGVNLLPILIPRLSATLPAGKAVIHAASHLPGVNALTGRADHPVSDDLTSLSTYARYPAKVAHEATDFARYGFGAHKEFSTGGQPRGEHSALAGFLSLLGIETSGGAAKHDVMDEAYDFLGRSTTRTTRTNTQRRHNLRDAIEAGDREESSRLMREMSPAQRRDFSRRSGKTPYQLLLERVPKADRPEFERRFRQRFEALQ